MATYSIYSVTQPRESAQCGFTGAEIARHIYRDDGEDYSVTPKMVPLEDDDGNVIGEIQSSWGDDLEWWVNFKSYNGKWKNEVTTAWGNTEEEAEEAYLNDAFRECAWDDSKWVIQSDEDYKKESENLETEEND